MKVAVFNTKNYDRDFLTEANNNQHELVFFDAHLTANTCKLAFEFEAICVFVNDQLSKNILNKLYNNGVRLIALRCAGFNNIDTDAARKLGMTIVRVPAYSPHGVAEHAVALILALNRKIYKAYNRVHEGNFSIDGLLGFELHGKTVGVIGVGKIGLNLARIMQGFGCKVLAYDPSPNAAAKKEGIKFFTLDEILKQSDILSLHSPLTPETYHLINKNSLRLMKDNVMIINTSRGGLIDTKAVIKSLKLGKVGYLGLDVYEEEEDIFFEDLSSHVLLDDTFARLLTFPNVIITGHQAFFTNTALKNIAETTIKNILDYENNSLEEKNVVLVPDK